MVEIKPIPGNAFAQCTRFDRHRLTGMVAHCDHDFNAMQKQLFKGVCGQRLDTAQGNALALPGLPHPITQIADAVLRPDFIQARAPRKSPVSWQKTPTSKAPPALRAASHTANHSNASRSEQVVEHQGIQCPTVSVDSRTAATKAGASVLRNGRKTRPSKVSAMACILMVSCEVYNNRQNSHGLDQERLDMACSTCVSSRKICSMLVTPVGAMVRAHARTWYTNRAAAQLK